MSDNVISYIEMCRREGTSLQAGMNFGLGGNHSVILMSLRANAPYRDRLDDGGTTKPEGCRSTGSLPLWFSVDHDLPWSKGGTSITENNVQLLCARHNLEKRDRIL